MTDKRRQVHPAVIFVAAVLLTVAALEFFLSRFPEVGKLDRKLWVKTKNLRGCCYTSNPRGYFPITVPRLSKGDVLYCVTYDPEQRRAGYFPGRPGQAAIVGDSFAYGEGLRDKDTLAYLLDKRFPEVNFRNLAVPGADINGVFKQVDAAVDNGEGIRTVLYILNLNDVLMSRSVWQRRNRIFDFQNLRWERRQKPPPGSLSALLTQSAIGRLVDKAVVKARLTRRTIGYYRDIYFDPVNRAALDRSIRRLEAMNELAVRNNVRFYVVVTPLFYKTLLGRYPFLKIHRLIEKICRERHIACFDAYGPFEKYYSLRKFILHPVDYHPNGLANRIVVDFLTRQKGFLTEWR